MIGPGRRPSRPSLRSGTSGDGGRSFPATDRTITRAARARPRRLAARQSCLTNHERAATGPGSEAGRVLELVVPVEPHVLDDAVAHHDDAGILGGEALVIGIGRHIDVIALFPGELFGFRVPFPDELV